MTIQAFFATCPKGLETLLLQELQSLGAETARETVAGVHFSGMLEIAYKACLWSRLANRILLPLAQGPAETPDALYALVQSVDWLSHMRASGTLAVDFGGRSRAITNTHFGALKVKDAVVDQVRAASGQRPNVDKQAPDIRINCHLHKGQCQVSLDLSGDSLHRRGYRLQGGEAPLKENLAAALLIRAGWPAMAAAGKPFVDPMCGSGTLLIEAGLMAAGVAPGVLRQRFGFEHWLQHNASLWLQLQREARATRQALKTVKLPGIHGYDAHPKAISISRENIERAGLSEHIRVSHRELKDLKPLTHHADIPPGLLLTNPPYGERLSDVPVIVYLYRHLGEALKKHFHGWQVGVFTGNPELGKAIAMRASKQYKFFNGAIASKLLMFDVEPGNFFAEDKPVTPDSAETAVDDSQQPYPAAAEMFANRLRKNLKQLDKWARKQDIQCYRVYDADMPEYAVAIDRYGDWVQVQEYAPPATVDPVKAVERLERVMAAVPAVMAVDPGKVVLKQRRRQSGKQQYEKLDQQEQFFEVKEGNARLLVNLQDYLDTGLFLDHRLLRQYIHKEAADKRFLNLFCYTGVATIQASVGGAYSTTSVDMSATYLDWLRRNLALNGLSEKLNEVIQADCFQWLRQAAAERQGYYDLIFMDPPTFSNSKRMQDTLDIQRDHVALIEAAMRLLSANGELLFSNNLRSFKLDEAALNDYEIRCITPETIDRDFARNSKVHHCWSIKPKALTASVWASARQEHE